MQGQREVTFVLLEGVFFFYPNLLCLPLGATQVHREKAKEDLLAIL